MERGFEKVAQWGPRHGSRSNSIVSDCLEIIWPTTKWRGLYLFFGSLHTREEEYSHRGVRRYSYGDMRITFSHHQNTTTFAIEVPVSVFRPL